MQCTEPSFVLCKATPLCGTFIVLGRPLKKCWISFAEAFHFTRLQPSHADSRFDIQEHDKIEQRVDTPTND